MTLAASAAPDPLPSRTVHVGDGLAWIAQASLADDAAIVTSLPDASELPGLGFDGWRAWFIDAAAQLVAATAPTSVTVFYQTDVKRDGRWIDKGFLVSLGAEQAGASLLFHKIACRVPAGNTTFGRPAYARLLAFSRARTIDAAASTPDVLPGIGHMTWSRAMGTAACVVIARFVRAIGARTVVDPFCGLGTMLAVANAHGLDAVGVELSEKRARRARALRLEGEAS